MLIRKLRECPEIAAGDQTRLRELLHPDGAYGFAGRYSLAHAVVRPNAQSVRHRLRTDEVYYILSGRGEMHVDDESASVEPGDAVEIPPESVQWIRNIGDTDLVFLCIVDPAWCDEDEEVLK
jgi:mannose-6-phosphate isomerase-like protein (cupin superfamily)